jgi:hypothetical protein
MDVLSEVLKVVKLQGAMFYNGEFFFPLEFSLAAFEHGRALCSTGGWARDHLSPID